VNLTTRRSPRGEGDLAAAKQSVSPFDLAFACLVLTRAIAGSDGARRHQRKLLGACVISTK
jgi:hypothetical protein